MLLLVQQVTTHRVLPWCNCNGIKSIICLPDGAPISKVEATKKYGAEVCLVKGVYDDAYEKAMQLKEEHNYTFVHPFDDEDVIAGQGTIGLELLNQLPEIDAVIVPIVVVSYFRCSFCH